MNRRIVVIGAVLILVAIILGAFGAHALKKVLNIEQLASYETGVRFQMYHGMIFLILGFSYSKLGFNSAWVVRLMLTGVLLFSCSIYLLSLQGVLFMNLNFLGPVTPIGGLLLIVSWILLIIQVLKIKTTEGKNEP